jgi:hypothetical protein
VVGGCSIAAWSASFGVLHRVHWISNQGKPPCTLINGGRRIDRLAIAPHPLVSTFARQLVGLLDRRFTLGPHLG